MTPNDTHNNCQNLADKSNISNNNLTMSENHWLAKKFYNIDPQDDSTRLGNVKISDLVKELTFKTLKNLTAAHSIILSDKLKCLWKIYISVLL